MWVGWVHHSWRFGQVETLREVGPEMPGRGSKTSTVPFVWATFGIFFGAIQMISCVVRWPWTKPSYITMTRRHSNNHWIGGIEAHPDQENSEFKNRLGSFRLDFFGIKTASSSLIIFQRAKLSTRSITHLCWCKWSTFWRKNPRRISPRRTCSCTTMPRLTGHLQPRRNWLTWASSVLITHPILRIWPRRTTSCSLDWKIKLKDRQFSSDAEVILAAETWLDGQPSEFALSGLRKLEQRAEKCIELRGVCVE